MDSRKEIIKDGIGGRREVRASYLHQVIGIEGWEEVQGEGKEEGGG